MNEQTVTFAAILVLIIALVIVGAAYLLPLVGGIHLPGVIR